MLPVGITPYYMSLLDREIRCSRCGGRSFRSRRIRAHAGRGGRSAGRGRRTAPCRAWCIAIPIACCSWRSTSARPIAVTARGRASSGTARSCRSEARLEKAFEYIRADAADSRRADLRRRSAGAGRGQARVDSRQPAGDPAHRVHPHRHQDAGRVAAADHAAAGPHVAEVPSDVDERALPPSRTNARRRPTQACAGWPTRAFRSARRPCCSRA